MAGQFLDTRRDSQTDYRQTDDTSSNGNVNEVSRRDRDGTSTKLSTQNGDTTSTNKSDSEARKNGTSHSESNSRTQRDSVSKNTRAGSGREVSETLSEGVSTSKSERALENKSSSDQVSVEPVSLGYRLQFVIKIDGGVMVDTCDEGKVADSVKQVSITHINQELDFDPVAVYRNARDNT